MPHTNKKTNSFRPPERLQPAQFVNINLTDDQRQAIKSVEWSVQTMDDALHALLYDGFKISMRFDRRNDCFAAWLIPPDGHKWSGMILSGRGSTPHKAIKQLCFLHFNALEQNWGTVQEQPAVRLDD